MFFLYHLFYQHNRVDYNFNYLLYFLYHFHVRIILISKFLGALFNVFYDFLINILNILMFYDYNLYRYIIVKVAQFNVLKYHIVNNLYVLLNWQVWVGLA